MLFVVFYVIDLAVYLFVIKSAQPTYLQGFLTSPFSPYEDYTSGYSSPQVGAIYNLGVVTFLILLTDCYFRLVRPSGFHVDVATCAFTLSVAASYILSGLEWVFWGAPSAGTSIIGSSMVLVLFVFSGRDVVVEARRRKQDSQVTPTPLGPIVFAVASAAVYVAEYVDSSSVLSHLTGDAIFAFLMALVLPSFGTFRRISEKTAKTLWIILQFLFAIAIGIAFLVYVANTAPLGWVFAVSSMSAYVIGDMFQFVFKKFSGWFDKTYVPLLFGFIVLLPLAVIIGAIGAVIPTDIIDAVTSSNFFGIATVEALTLVVPSALVADVFLTLKRSWNVYPRRN